MTRWLACLCIGGLFVFQAVSLNAAEHPGGTVEHAGESLKDQAAPGKGADEGSQPAESDVTGTEAPAGEAQEHPGETQEHPGQEHPGTTRLETPSNWIQLAKETKRVPSPDEIRAAMDAYARDDSRLKGGHFLLYDPKVDQVLSLEFVRVHERVGKLRTREGYFSCCDFKDAKGPTMYDVDFWMNDDLEITDVMVHKVDGKPRFTYDENDNRIELN